MGRKTLRFADLLSRNFSTKGPEQLQKMHRTIPQLIEFHTANSKRLTIFNHIKNVIKDKPVTSEDSKNSYPTYCENGEVQFNPQTFNNGHRIKIEPLTDHNISLEVLVPFQD